jgi:acetylornithine deacetylase
LPRLNLGVIRGGITPEFLTWRPALVPDYCQMVVDVRIVPGQSPESVMADLRRLLETLQAQDPDLKAEAEFGQDHIYFPPFEVPLDSLIVQTVKAAHQEIFGSAPRVGALAPQKYAGADSAHMLKAGIPGILYGPGGKFLSVPDERVEVENIVRASQVFALSIGRIWGMH